MFAWFRRNRVILKQIHLLRHEMQVVKAQNDLILARQSGDENKIRGLVRELENSRESLEAAVASASH